MDFPFALFRPFRLCVIALCTVLSGLAGPAFSQEEGEDEEDDPFHVHADFEQIIVTASPTGRARFDVLQSTAVLSGDKLEEDLGGNIGETLDHLPGISQSYFGPGAGRPIIRGLGGDRVRILIGGIGTIDASSTSPDHAVAGDVLTTQTIEVIRGPATLLYGNNAVGGVVNMLDGRIPFQTPEDGFTGIGRVLYGTNADDISFAAATDVEFAPDWVLHLDGSWRDASDIEIPGFLRSTALREAEPLEPGEQEVTGVAPNTSLDNNAFSAGLSRFFRGGFAGISVSRTRNNYGVPSPHAHGGEGEEEEGEESVRIDLDQLRFDFMSEVDREFLIFETVKTRFGYGDYEHVELEGAETGTIFLTEGWEGRVEFVQKRGPNLGGAMGFQIRRRKFEAIGEEAFVPPSRTTQYGLFVVEEYQHGNWSFEGGARLEFQDVSAPTMGVSRSFAGVSVSAGVSYLFEGGILLGITGHRTERAPNAEELFSNGPHLATRAFEIGDPALGEEVASGFEIALRKRAGRLHGGASFFYTAYDNFIFEQADGTEMDELPVFRFTASDVRFTGGEFELVLEAYQGDAVQLLFEAVIDYVRASERAGGMPLPRIPPLSFHVGGEVTSEYADFRLEVDHADAQDRVAMMETETPGYTALNTSLAIRPFGRGKDLTIRIQGRNLTNEDIRYHTSFLKDFLPAPGRSIRISVQGGF